MGVLSPVPPPAPTLVADSESLQRLIDDLCAAVPPGGRLVVDTEFHAERRYRPELMLVQLGAEQGPIWVVDPLTVDPAPLASLLTGRIWLAHGARSDLRVLAESLGALPAGLRDSQVLAGLCGLGFPRRLEDLCERVLGPEAGPAETLSDWSVRPLRPDQLVYAARDVHQVRGLVAALEPDLDDEGRAIWAELGDEMIAASLAPVDTDAGWMGLEIAADFDAATRRVLHRLHAWREARSAERNQPTGYLASDAVILDLARRKPRSVTVLAQNRRLSRGLIKGQGQALVDQVIAALADDVEAPVPPDPGVRRLARLLRMWAQVRQESLGMHADLLLPVPLALQVAQDGADVLSGWRRRLLFEDIDAFLSGKIGLTIADRIPIQTPVLRLGAVPDRS